MTIHSNHYYKVKKQNEGCKITFNYFLVPDTTPLSHPQAKLFFTLFFLSQVFFFQVTTLATSSDLTYKGLGCSFTCAQIQIGQQLLSSGLPLPVLQYTWPGEFRPTPCQDQGQLFPKLAGQSAAASQDSVLATK